MSRAPWFAALRRYDVSASRFNLAAAFCAGWIGGTLVCALAWWLS